jgi:hypothetical protein
VVNLLIINRLRRHHSPSGRQSLLQNASRHFPNHTNPRIKLVLRLAATRYPGSVRNGEPVGQAHRRERGPPQGTPRILYPIRGRLATLFFSFVRRRCPAAADRKDRFWGRDKGRISGQCSSDPGGGDFASSSRDAADRGPSLKGPCGGRQGIVVSTINHC